MTEPKRDDTWADWGPAPTPREYFEGLIRHERELRERDATAHAAVHATATVTLAHTVELLNDVQRRFVDKAVFESDGKAVEARFHELARLVWGLLIIGLVSLSSVVATLATR